MSFFRVIIPTYNNARTVKRAIKSVLRQTFDDYDLIVVDDCSTDDTWDEVEKLLDGKDCLLIKLNNKCWNGGTRNRAMVYSTDTKYTLFLDADDEFADEGVFQRIHDIAEQKNYPDMIRLGYMKHYDDDACGKPAGYEKDRTIAIANEKCIKDVVISPCVACWTKAVKTELLQPFPENTLMEDVEQHLRQCDVCDTMCVLEGVSVKWHRNNISTSHTQNSKWRASAYRHIANLMDMQGTFKKQCVNDRAKFKLDFCLSRLSMGAYDQ